MNLAAMAAFICGKVNLTEAEDLAAAKGFLSRRLEMIWNDQLWKDSLVEYVRVISPDGYTAASNWIPTKSILLCPPAIQRVIGVRTTERQLNAMDHAYYYRVDYDAWHKSGLPIEQVRLPACVWELDQARAVYVSFDAANAGANLSLDLADSDGCGSTRSNVALAASPQLLGTTERIDGVRKKVSTAAVVVHAAEDVLPADDTGYNAEGYVSWGGILDPTNGLTIGQTYLWTTGVGVLQFTCGTTVLNDSGIFTADATIATVQSTGVPLDLMRGTLRPAPSIVTLAAADTMAARRQRIRLVESPTVETTISVLGKRSCPPLLEDEDEPALQGVENCLLAFAQSDLLQRERHYAKADQVMKEGLLLLQQFMAMEVVQQSHNQRIIPEMGYADDYALRGLKFGF